MTERNVEVMKCGSVPVVCALALAMFSVSTAQAWEPVRLRASGVGYAPARLAGTTRGRLMAERAAKIVATHNLARHLYRIPPGESFTAYVPGVKTAWSRPLPGYGIEATVETRLPTGYGRYRIIEW